MSRAALDQALRAAGSLSAQELEQLGAKIAALRALSGPAAPAPPVGAAGPAAFAETLYSAMAEVLLLSTGTQIIPYQNFLRTRHGRAFPSAAAAASATHLAWFPKATRQETVLLCRTYAGCLMSYVGQRAHWPFLIAAMSSLPDVVDQSFPGYARSGLLPLLIQARATSA